MRLIEDGRYHATAWTEWDDEAYVLPCTLTVEDGELTFDFTGTSPQAPHYFNSKPYIVESELAVNFAVKKGYPADYFVQFPHRALSTRAEARVLVPELRRLGAHSFLLVTSDYHTRRAGRYFRRLADGLDMRVVAAPDEYFRWNSWWRNREAQKIFYMEWSKTVAGLFGL